MKNLLNSIDVKLTKWFAAHGTIKAILIVGTLTGTAFKYGGKVEQWAEEKMTMKNKVTSLDSTIVRTNKRLDNIEKLSLTAVYAINAVKDSQAIYQLKNDQEHKNLSTKIDSSFKKKL
jgi:hypothetical protein